ncbi:hypothetical protein ES703_117952 [subsurface metagenome]
MAYWRHRTKTGRVVYDRPKNEFRISDLKRITGKLKKPYVVLPQAAWTALFSPIDGHFLEYLHVMETRGLIGLYLLDGTVVPGMRPPVYWPADWPAKLAEAIHGREHVTLARSPWIG